VIDPIDSESLRGSELQRTLLKPRKLLRNLACYEGARFKLYRVSGKRCSNRHSRCVEVGRRKYRCPRCGVEWDRDKCATFWLLKRFLDEHLQEECSDETYVDVYGWLLRHSKDFATLESPVSASQPVPRGGTPSGETPPRAPARGTEEAVKRREAPSP
jgi:hypothetical protein